MRILLPACMGLLLLVTSCGPRVPAQTGSVGTRSPAVSAVPAGGLVIGQRTAVRIQTRCRPDHGLLFAGSYWVPDSAIIAPLSEPYQDGTLTVTAGDRATFDYVAADGSAGRIQYRVNPGGPVMEPLAGCGPPQG